MARQMPSSPALALHEAGYKITDQRRKVLDILRNNREHLTAEDIYAYLHNRSERISLGTIYRTLELLEKIELVRRISLDDRNRYELIDDHSDLKHHYHLICEKCGKIMDVDESTITEHAESIEKLVVEVTRFSGFKVSGHQFRIFGKCANCK